MLFHILLRMCMYTIRATQGHLHMWAILTNTYDHRGYVHKSVYSSRANVICIILQPKTVLACFLDPLDMFSWFFLICFLDFLDMFSWFLSPRNLVPLMVGLLSLRLAYVERRNHVSCWMNYIVHTSKHIYRTRAIVRWAGTLAMDG